MSKSFEEGLSKADLEKMARETTQDNATRQAEADRQTLEAREALEKQQGS